MRVVFKDTFLSRLDKQVDYLARGGHRAGQKFRKEIIQVIKQIPKNPYQYRKSIYFDDILVRDLIYKGYTITFFINGNVIEIFGFTRYQQHVTD